MKAVKSHLLFIVAALVLGHSLKAEEIEVSSIPIASDIDDVSRNTIRDLTWRGGLILKSKHPDFGGLSGLSISKDGKTLTAVSDRGHWFKADIHYQDGNLASIGNATIEPILDAAGQPVKGRSSDAESIAFAPNGDILVSFEHFHRIARYSPGATKASRFKTPPATQRLPPNGGIEAMTEQCNGNLVIVAEKNVQPQDYVEGWIEKNEAWQPFKYKTVAGFRPTGAALLPDCGLIFVERSFSFVDGVKGRIVIISNLDPSPNAIVEPKQIARLEPPLTVDNFEGISIRTGEDGETFIYILSDDNFNLSQRTLLFMFKADW